MFQENHQPDIYIYINPNQNHHFPSGKLIIYIHLEVMFLLRPQAFTGPGTAISSTQERINPYGARGATQGLDLYIDLVKRNHGKMDKVIGKNL